MCGRYELNLTPAQVRQLFAELFEARAPLLPGDLVWPEARPTDLLPVIRMGAQGAPECIRLRWGLVPHWAREMKAGRPQINARAETAHEKPAFRDAVRARRCVVPASAFFEWRTLDNGRRAPVRIAPAQAGGLFLFAGLWDRWAKGPDGPLESFTILTLPANGVIAPIHDRMPALLDEAGARTWLGVPDTALLRPAPDDWVRIENTAPPLSVPPAKRLAKAPAAQMQLFD